jgi:hypothetical protein
LQRQNKRCLHNSRQKDCADCVSRDRNGDGRIDVVFFDFQQRGKWDLSFWDDSFTGRWTLVGYHLDGSLKPSKFESYDVFQKKLAQR